MTDSEFSGMRKSIPYNLADYSGRVPDGRGIRSLLGFQADLIRHPHPKADKVIVGLRDECINEEIVCFGAWILQHGEGLDGSYV
jgi:hypothetical protein